jgi:ADP-ribose pyrophosphatase YjhB (NUDIX family)
MSSQRPGSDTRIRPLALALIRKDEQILVEEGRDEVKNETFFRLLGGVIDFGEKGADAVQRELREELGVESQVNPRAAVATFENVFTYEGDPCHEIVLIYECSLRDDSLYSLDRWKTHEETRDGIVVHKVEWKRLDDFHDTGDILYPEGLQALLGQQ